MRFPIRVDADGRPVDGEHIFERKLYELAVVEYDGADEIVAVQWLRLGAVDHEVRRLLIALSHEDEAGEVVARDVRIGGWISISDERGVACRRPAKRAVEDLFEFAALHRPVTR